MNEFPSDDTRETREAGITGGGAGNLGRVLNCIKREARGVGTRITFDSVLGVPCCLGSSCRARETCSRISHQRHTLVPVAFKSCHAFSAVTCGFPPRHQPAPLSRVALKTSGRTWPGQSVVHSHLSQAEFLRVVRIAHPYELRRLDIVAQASLNSSQSGQAGIVFPTLPHPPLP